MTTNRFVAHHVLECLIAPDRSVIALQVEGDDGTILSVEIAAAQAHKLMRSLLTAVIRLPAEKSPPIGTGKAFLVTHFEIGAGFPEGVILNIQTEQFGRQGFAFRPDIANELGAALQRYAKQIAADQSNRGSDH